MNITRNIYEQIINNVPADPPESGGILGTDKSGDIRFAEFDEGLHNGSYSKKCIYAPDVEFMNVCIKKWEELGIQFCGIFHTHFHGVSSMSKGDMRYIYRIMDAMPQTIEKLYFPIIVLPGREMKAYYCLRERKRLRILCDDIEIVEEV